MPSASIDFSTSRLPGTFDPALLPAVRDWKWIASFGRDLESPVRHALHRQWIRNPENVHAPPHRSVFLTLTGESVRGFGDQVYREVPGSVFLFDRHEPRENKRPDYKRNFSRLWLNLINHEFFTFNTVRVDAAGQAFRDLSKMRIQSGEPARRLMEAWTHSREHPENALSWEYLKSVVAATCLEILGTAQPVPPPDNSHQQIIAAVQSRIRSHPGEAWNLQHLADLAGYSPFFFHRLFLRETGQTPKAFVDGVRLEKIREMLRENYTLDAIAEAVGMSSASYVGIFFKKFMRRSPRKWMELDRGSGSKS
ncbi:MAG TPA: AraC family transcriptional regulator [Chthoniobacteraceae bacterium]|nr:AraC family transcriptional regulator [Chthoniobacteraceae bacterium]